MKKLQKLTLIIILTLILALMAVILISRLCYKRTLQATIAELYLKLTVKHVTGEEMERGLLELKARKEQPYLLPADTQVEGGITSENFENMPVMYLNKEGKGKLILYLHGGSYLHHPDPHHYKFLSRLIKKTDARVILPVYPKTPWHDFTEAYDLVSKLYEKISREEDIILMGDSAGGGLALGVAQYFHTLELKEPLGIITFSPWLDLTMENPAIKEYEKVDPWLRLASSLPIAKSWANGTELTDYRISPTFGDLQGLNNVTVFVGTREILYPDIIKFTEKMKQKNMDFQLFIGEGLNHVYPLFPIPEGAEAIAELVKILEELEADAAAAKCLLRK
ncbi:alpha/beta hydrolase [Clostridiales bacterium COT073_COT-073]|nr:alpha/beta hydrolase [Clostridiales bacterium COT073_COT-073]